MDFKDDYMMINKEIYGFCKGYFRLFFAEFVGDLWNLKMFDDKYYQIS